MLTFISFFCNICVDVRNNRYAALVKRLRRSPLTAESRVRFPDAVPRYKPLVSVGVSKASGIFYLLCISSTYSAVIIPAGSATTAIPRNDEIIAIIRPTIVTGYISPYPTVVRETVAQYTASK